MATVRDGDKSVLMIIDVQAGVMDGAWDAARVIKNVALAAERARSEGVPIFWLQHSDDELIEGSEEWQWVDELSPAPNEPLIHKRFNSAFELTKLEGELAARDISHIVLAGASTNWCIRATAYAALDRGYDVTLIRDGHTTTGVRNHEGRMLEAAPMIDELNVAMTWLTYPGRTSGTVAAKDLDFDCLREPD